jgi:hypothetical protein
MLLFSTDSTRSVVVPAATIVIAPVDALIVATPVSEELYATDESATFVVVTVADIDIPVEVV